MKRILAILCACLLVVGLTGCSDATTNVSDKKDVVIKVGKSKIKKGDVYNCLIATGNVSDVEDKINVALLNKAVETTDEIQKAADEDLASYKKSIGEDKWEDYYKNLGYETEDEFVNNEIMPEIKSQYLQKQYVNDQYSSIVKEFEPMKLQICQITNGDNNDKAEEMLKDEDVKIEDIVKKYGDTTTYDGKEHIYTNQSGIPAQVWSSIKQLEKGKISEPILETDSGYIYIVKVVDNDTTAMEEELKTYFETFSYTDSDGLSFADQIYKYYLKQNKFGVYDATVYAALISDSAKYKKD